MLQIYINWHGFGKLKRDCLGRRGFDLPAKKRKKERATANR